MKYVQPKLLKEWVKDEPGSEYYCVMVFDDRTVVSACGRFAQGSGSKSVSWDAFVVGDMSDLVSSTMGIDVLNESKRFVAQCLKNG